MLMKSGFSSVFFAGNRQRLRESIGSTAPIVITANGQLQRAADFTYPFQQDANFWYLTGINDPDVLLVMDDDDEYIVLYKSSEYRDTFDGKVDANEIRKKSGIQTVLDYEMGWQRLKARLGEVKEVATVAAPPEYIEVYGIYTNPARRRLCDTLKEQNEHLNLVDISKHMAMLRVIKQPEELRAIKRAIVVTKQSLQELMEADMLQHYTYEYEIEADLTRAFRKRGARHAFDPIIAGGKRASTLHNITMQGRIARDELLLFDVGAEWEGYAADISRTVALQKPTARQQAVFDTVKEVQAYAYSVLKPGVLPGEYEMQVERKVGEKLIALGLIKTNNTDSVREYYPHAASHHVGLNVHDVGDRKQPLAENMVLTVEPGIYIPEESIGVRIEDDVRITDTGVEVLTSALPTKLV